MLQQDITLNDDKTAFSTYVLSMFCSLMALPCVFRFKKGENSMKRVSENTMRSVNGGGWVCLYCGHWYATKSAALWHTILSGHAFKYKG